MPHGEYDWNGFWTNPTPMLWNTNRVDPNLIEYFPMDTRSALEIGFGSGVNSHWMTTTGAKVTAIEISQSAVEQAQSNYPGPTYLQQSILEKPQTTYDFIFDRAVYHMFIPDALRDSFIQSVHNRMDSESTWLSIVILYGYKRFKDYNIQDAIKPLLPYFNVEYYIGTTELVEHMEPCIVIRSKKK